MMTFITILLFSCSILEPRVLENLITSIAFLNSWRDKLILIVDDY